MRRTFNSRELGWLIVASFWLRAVQVGLGSAACVAIGPNRTETAAAAAMRALNEWRRREMRQHPGGAAKFRLRAGWRVPIDIHTLFSSLEVQASSRCSTGFIA
jgi:hypothetical protein